MARQDNGENGEGGRWDVGAKDGAVYVERRSQEDDQIFSDRLEPGEARDLAALLNKYADKAESPDRDDSSDDDDDDSDDDDDDSDDDDDDSDDSDDDDDEDDADDDDDSDDDDSDDDDDGGDESNRS